MKRIAILVLLLASVASAAYLRILAEYAVNGTLTTTDSIRVNLYYGGTQYNYLTTNVSNLDTVVVVDTTGVYSYWARYYLSGAEKLRDFRNAQAMSGVDFVTGTQIDSVLNAIEDANKPNFKATGFATSTQGDSITGAITDANKANFKATGFATSAQGDSLTNAITDANKANFKATGFSTFNPASDSVLVDESTFWGTGVVVNDKTGFSLANLNADTLRDVIGDSTTAWKDSILNAIEDANKANFKATGFSTYNPASDSVLVDESTLWGIGVTANNINPDSVRDIVGDSLTAFKATVLDSLANQAWATAGTATIPDSVTQAVMEIQDSVQTQVWATDGGTATADIYPLLERKTTVDAVGATANLLFVIDTTALGTSSETTLLEKAVTIRDADDGKWIKATTIARANCVADNCTLQVAAALPWDVDAGDSVWFWGDRTVPDYPTSAALAAEIRDTVLSTDTTGYRSDATMGGMIVAGGTTAGGSDTTAIKSMLTNNQVLEAADSTVAMANTSLGKGAPRRGEIADTASVSRSVWDNDVVAKVSRTVGVVDSTGKLGEEVLSSLPDSVTQAVMEIQDSVQTQAWASAGVATLPDSVTSAVMEIQDSVQSQSWAATGSGGSACPDSGGYVVTIYAYDTTNAEVVENATIRVKSSLTGATRATATTRTGGFFQFTMANGKHYLLANANGVTFALDSVTIADAALTDTIYGSGFVIAAPSAANLTTVSGQADCYSCQVRFILDAQGAVTDTSTSQLVTKKVYNTKTNANGQFSQELPKTGNMLYQSGTQIKHPKWRILISPTDVIKEPKLEMSFEIPADSTTLNIGGLLQ